MSSAPHVIARRIRLSIVSAAVASMVAATGACSADSPTDDASESIVRVTTNVAGAGVIGIDRKTANACPAAAPVDTTGVVGTTRDILQARGTTSIPSDPQRIVVLDTEALDAACALGLWERVVGAAVPTVMQGRSGDQPSYLGSGIGAITGVGAVGAPDIDQIRRLKPDVIIGSTTSSTDDYASLTEVAPTVLTQSPDWKQRFIQSGAAMGRGGTALQLLAGFHDDATAVGARLDATQTQASLIRFESEKIRVDGSDSFAGQVLDEAGVQRPPRQNVSSFDIPSDNVSAAEGDVIYVHFDGEDGQTYGSSVLRSPGWESLGASTDGRVFAVDDAVWAGDGIVAARAILDDLTNSLNGYVQ